MGQQSEGGCGNSCSWYHSEDPSRGVLVLAITCIYGFDVLSASHFQLIFSVPFVYHFLLGVSEVPLWLYVRHKFQEFLDFIKTWKSYVKSAIEN